MTVLSNVTASTLSLAVSSLVVTSVLQHRQSVHTGHGETLVERDPVSQDTHTTVTASVKLFKPGQKTILPPASSAIVQSTDYQANVNAVAQQAREQQLKQKQAAVTAEVELDRLKGLLQRETALQV